MNAIEVQTSLDRYIISIDKSLMDKDILFSFLERLKLEELARKVNFDESILEIGEEINVNWWKNNKSRFIPEA